MQQHITHPISRAKFRFSADQIPLRLSVKSFCFAQKDTSPAATLDTPAREALSYCQRGG